MTAPVLMRTQQLNASTTSNGKTPTGQTFAKQADSVAISAPPPSPLAEPVRVNPSQLFAEGKLAYDRGDYKIAIRKLQSSTESSAAGSLLLRDAYKLLAFSHCVTNQPAACRSAFSNMLRVDPSFQLSRSEAGHPQWGPVFRDVHASLNSKAAKK